MIGLRLVLEQTTDTLNYNIFNKQIEWYDDEYPTFDECIRFTYTKTELNKFSMTLDLKNGSNNYTSDQYQGTGKVSYPSLLSFLPIVGSLLTPGELSIAFDPNTPGRPNHQILATDYKSYAFVWDCQNVNATHYNEKMWWFAREPIPSERPKKVAELEKHFDPNFIRKTIQDDRCGWKFE